MKPIPITTRAELREGARIHVLPAPKVGHIRHVLPFPVAVCPVSRNPLSGTITIEYRPKAYVLEVVSLHNVVDEVVTASSSVEGAATDIALELLKALGFHPEIVVEVQVLPGPQTLTVWPVVSG